MATYRAGVIGLNLGRSHVRGFDAADGIDVAAVCDIDAERLEVVADEFDVPGRYTDAEDMLRTESLDIVSVATPPALHAVLTLLVARFPVQAIISEKPLATSMGEAEAMLAACDRAGIKLLCGHQGRHVRAFQVARDLVAEGAIGRPSLVKVGVNEGGLLNQGSHLIDRALYVLGEPEPVWVFGQVQRETDRYERGSACEDLCFGMAAVQGGARIIYDNDIGPHGDLVERTFIVVGDAGTMIIASAEHSRPGAFGLRVNSAHREDLLVPPDDEPIDHMLAQARELVAWLRGDIDAHRQDAHHAIKSQAIMMGIYESARTHTLVRMPMRTKVAPLDAAIAQGALQVRYPGAYDIRRPFVYPRSDIA